MLKVITHPIQPFLEVVYDDKLDKYYPLSELPILKMKEKMQNLLYEKIDKNIKKFNKIYNVDFSSLSSITRFANAPHYPYHKEVAKLDDWVVDVWAYARSYEKEVKEGRKKFNENEFIENIPSFFLDDIEDDS